MGPRPRPWVPDLHSLMNVIKAEKEFPLCYSIRIIRLYCSAGRSRSSGEDGWLGKPMRIHHRRLLFRKRGGFEIGH